MEREMDTKKDIGIKYEENFLRNVREILHDRDISAVELADRLQWLPSKAIKLKNIGTDCKSAAKHITLSDATTIANELGYSVEQLMTKSYDSENKIIDLVPAPETDERRCSFCGTESTFARKDNGKQFFHYQYFIANGGYVLEEKYTSDANILCLCPNCHNLLEYGTDLDREKMVLKVYLDRRDKLVEAGIDVSLPKIMSYYKLG